jgi:hypothetical protein
LQIYENYNEIVRIFPDLETGYDFNATVAGPFTMLPVREYTEPWHGQGKLLPDKL